MVQPSRLSEQSTMLPGARDIGEPVAATTIWLPSKRCRTILPAFAPAPASKPLYPRSLPPAAWKFFMPTPTPMLVELVALNRCDHRIVNSSEHVSHGS